MHFASIILFSFAAMASLSFGSVVSYPERGVCSVFQSNGLQNLELIGCPPSTLEHREVDPSELCAALFDGGLVNLESVGCQPSMFSKRSAHRGPQPACDHSSLCSFSGNALVTAGLWMCDGWNAPALDGGACNQKACRILQNGLIDAALFGCDA